MSYRPFLPITSLALFLPFQINTERLRSRVPISNAQSPDFPPLEARLLRRLPPGHAALPVLPPLIPGGRARQPDPRSPSSLTTWNYVDQPLIDSSSAAAFDDPVTRTRVYWAGFAF